MNSTTLVLFFAFAIAVVSAQFETKPAVPILQLHDARDEAGQYSLRYVTGDGTTVDEQGRLKPNADGTDYVLVKEGKYTFTTPEGQTLTVEYVADENGFRPVGDHLPFAV